MSCAVLWYSPFAVFLCGSIRELTTKKAARNFYNCVVLISEPSQKAAEVFINTNDDHCKNTRKRAMARKCVIVVSPPDFFSIFVVVVRFLFLD